MRRFKLTLFAKLLIFILVVAVIGTTLYLTGSFDNMMAGKDQSPGKVDIGTVNPTTKPVDNQNPAPTTGDKKPDMVISLDEWIGWKPITDANGGLDTVAGSIFDKYGITVSIKIINDATQSSTALINGSIDGAGYTINRYAFLYPKFVENNVPVIMPFIVNASAGGDGIIAKADIKSIESLVGKKVGVPRYSEAQTLIEWLLSTSSLSDEEVAKIRQDMVMFDTPDDAAKAFFAGKVDAAATWQPYLTQAQDTTGARLLFSTKNATNLILDGIVFRKDYLDANKEVVSKFIQGVIEAHGMYKTEFTAIKNAMPLFATEINDNIAAMADDAILSNYNDNKILLDGVAQSLFADMSSVWKQLGEVAKPEAAADAFDAAIIQSLASQYAQAEPVSNKPAFTEEQREEAKAQSNDQALLKQTLSINFDTGAATISADSYGALNEFAKVAKILNNVIIQIEGNTDSVGSVESNTKLSEQRAKAVATYLQYQDIDPSRFVIIGNGPNKPIGDNNTEEGRAANRRTDIFFKVVD